MPIKQAAVKDLRQNERRRVRNVRVKRTLRTLNKAFDEALKAGNTSEAAKVYVELQQQYDKAAKSFLKKETASRKKSRAAKRLAAAQAKPTK